MILRCGHDTDKDGVQFFGWVRTIYDARTVPQPGGGFVLDGYRSDDFVNFTVATCGECGRRTTKAERMQLLQASMSWQ